MNFTTLTLERYSVRSFKNEPVTEVQIEEILEVARNAPTACNRQPQRIFVLFSHVGREKIKRSTECHFNAPLFFVVCYDRNESWKRAFDEQDYGMVDASIVMKTSDVESACRVLKDAKIGTMSIEEIANGK